MNNDKEVYFIDENNWLCIVRPGILCGGTNYTEVQPTKSDELDKMLVASGLETDPLYYDQYTIIDDDRCLAKTEENRIKLLAIASALNIDILKSMNDVIERHANSLANAQLRRTSMEKFIHMSNNSSS